RRGMTMEDVKGFNGGAGNLPPKQLFHEPLQSEADTEILNEEVNRAANENNFRPPGVQIPNLRYAGFWMRFWAYIIDLIVIGSINRLLVEPVFMMLGLELTDTSIFAPIVIVHAIVFYTYFVLMTKFFGQTLGKMILGLRVIDLDGKRLTWSTVLFREWIGRYI